VRIAFSKSGRRPGFFLLAEVWEKVLWKVSDEEVRDDDASPEFLQPLIELVVW